jgi:SAM-dependent methyltransferase
MTSADHHPLEGVRLCAADEDKVGFYSENAVRLFALYRALPFETAHCAWLHLLPEAPLRVLDVGAGSGRDANWFSDHGYDVVAVEPCQEFIALSKASSQGGVCWINDSLPGLAEVSRLGYRYDVVLLSAVWMHVLPEERGESFRVLSGLLASRGILVITLRETPFDDSRSFFPTRPEELRTSARERGLESLLEIQTAHTPGQPELRWRTFVFREPERQESHPRL